MLAQVNISSQGDSVYDEDEDTKELELKIAALAGKEAGLFCVSGTLSNQIALRTHLHQPPTSIVCDYRSHIICNEALGVATLCQAMPIGVIPSNGKYLVLEDIIPRLVADDGNIHFAPTKLVSLENTIGGVLIPMLEIARISEYCKSHLIRLHCDGARLWNAAVAEGVSLKELCSYFDSVSLCLSKTLGAPIGSVLVGETNYIKKANHFRKQNGGGVRQSGLLLRMAMYAVDYNYGKLAKTHEMAKDLENFLIEKGIPVLAPVDTNFVFLDLEKLKMSNTVLVNIASKLGINVRGARILFHYQNSTESLQLLKQAILETYEYLLVHQDEPIVPVVKY